MPHVTSPTRRDGNDARKRTTASRTFSPVNENGCFAFDRVIKSGDVLKRTRKTKSWKSVHLVLRPHMLSIYKDSDGTQLRHQIQLADVTAVARQRDPKKKAKHVFALFSPERNYHIEAASDAEAQKWVEAIRSEARIAEEEDEVIALMSPTIERPPGSSNGESGFFNLAVSGSHTAGSTSASEFEASQPLQIRKTRSRNNINTMHSARKSSLGVHNFSGAEQASFSDFSDGERAFSNPQGSVLSLSLGNAQSQGYSSSTQAEKDERDRKVNAIYRPSTTAGETTRSRPDIVRNLSGVSVSRAQTVPTSSDSERVIYNSTLQFLKHGHLKQWKLVWAVLRPKSLALYRNSDEYQPLRIIDFKDIVDAVETDDLGKHKKHCFQVIAEEKRWRFCAGSEEQLAGWVGAFKSLVARRREGGRLREEEKKEIERLKGLQGPPAVASQAGTQGGRRVVSEPVARNR